MDLERNPACRKIVIIRYFPLSCSWFSRKPLLPTQRTCSIRLASWWLALTCHIREPRFKWCQMMLLVLRETVLQRLVWVASWNFTPQNIIWGQFASGLLYIFHHDSVSIFSFTFYCFCRFQCNLRRPPQGRTRNQNTLYFIFISRCRTCLVTLRLSIRTPVCVAAKLNINNNFATCYSQLEKCNAKKEHRTNHIRTLFWTSYACCPNPKVALQDESNQKRNINDYKSTVFDVPHDYCKLAVDWFPLFYPK